MTRRGYQAIAHLDCIQLSGIRAQGRHGVYPSERQQGQPFAADVDMYCDLSAAASSDSVADTTDYSVVAARVREVLAGQAHNLIEAVAAHVASAVLEFPQVQAVRVRVHKPEAPMDTPADDVAVTLWRGLGFDSDAPDMRQGEGATEGAAERPTQQPDGGEDEDGRTARKSANPAAAPDLADPAALDAGVATGFPGIDHSPRWPRSAVLALGANLGNRTQTLLEVVGQLDHTPGVGVTEVSPLVQSAAVVAPGQPSQPDYLNAVVIVQTSLSPRELLAAMQRIEQAHGRERKERWAARTLDIDIVTYQGVYSEDPQLTLPHPRAGQRAFVLLPWSHIDPDARLNGRPIGELAAEAPDRRGIRSIDPTWLKDAALADAEDGPLPLPQWKALDEAAPRILDDPEAVVRSAEPVDPRFSMEPKAQGGRALGLAGVSDRAGGGPAELTGYDPAFAKAQLRAPSLWERIKAFFAGRKARPQAVKVVDTHAASPTPAPSVPELPQPASSSTRGRLVDIEAPQTAVEGVDTVSLRTLDTAAMDQVQARRAADELSADGQAAAASPDRAVAAGVGGEAPEGDAADLAAAGAEAGEASSRREAPKPQDARASAAPAVVPPDEPTARPASFVPVPPPPAEAAEQGQDEGRNEGKDEDRAGVPEPVAPARTRDTEGTDSAVPAAPAGEDGAEDADRPASEAVAASEDAPEEPGEDEAGQSAAAPAAPAGEDAPGQQPLPRGLARLFANADLSAPNPDFAAEHSPGSAGPAAPATQETSAGPEEAAPRRPRRAHGGPGKAPSSSLPNVPKPPKHAAPAVSDQAPPPPPIPAPMMPPATQEFSAQDIADAGRAAQQAPVKRTSIIRPTTTGIIPVVKTPPTPDEDAPAGETAAEADTAAAAKERPASQQQEDQ